jgi:hypothetical protein
MFHIQFSFTKIKQSALKKNTNTISQKAYKCADTRLKDNGPKCGKAVSFLAL